MEVEFCFMAFFFTITFCEFIVYMYIQRNVSHFQQNLEVRFR